MPRNDNVLRATGNDINRLKQRHACGVCVWWACVAPVVVGESRSPVGRPEQRLQSAGQIHEQITHQEEPAETQTSSHDTPNLWWLQKTCDGEKVIKIIPVCVIVYEWPWVKLLNSYMDSMGATRSSDAIRIPSSARTAVSRRAHVGSPLAFPWPNTYTNTQTHTHRHLGMKYFGLLPHLSTDLV